MSRREFSNYTKAQAAIRANGHCEGCTRRLLAGDYNYDHIVPHAMGGPSTADNIQLLCKACHGSKTTKQDVPQIAKAKRRERARFGIKKPRTITRWRKFNRDIVIAERDR